MRPANILVIEQDKGIAEMITKALEGAGYRVVKASDALNGLKKLYDAYPDLIIMAKELPAVKGEEACQRVRQASYLPLIVLGKEDEAVEMLDMGADVFMKKPLHLKELVARVRSLLRRKQQLDPPKKDDDTPDKGEDNGPGLTPTENRLASCLEMNRGKVIASSQLIDEVWEGKDVKPNTLHYYMRRLRRKMADLDISEVRGVGYGLKKEPGSFIS